MSINSINKYGPYKTRKVFTRTESDSAAGCSMKKVMEGFKVHNSPVSKFSTLVKSRPIKILIIVFTYNTAEPAKNPKAK